MSAAGATCHALVGSVEDDRYNYPAAGASPGKPKSGDTSSTAATISDPDQDYDLFCSQRYGDATTVALCPTQMVDILEMAALLRGPSVEDLRVRLPESRTDIDSTDLHNYAYYAYYLRILSSSKYA